MGAACGAEAFAMQSKFRFIARKSFIKWDCGERMQRAMLRNAGPVPGPYRLGDIVSYCREARKGETGIQLVLVLFLSSLQV